MPPGGRQVRDEPAMFIRRRAAVPPRLGCRTGTSALTEVSQESCQVGRGIDVRIPARHVDRLEQAWPAGEDRAQARIAAGLGGQRPEAAVEEDRMTGDLRRAKVSRPNRRSTLPAPGPPRRR